VQAEVGQQASLKADQKTKAKHSVLAWAEEIADKALSQVPVLA
jgi:hypothetical protein